MLARSNEARSRVLLVLITHWDSAAQLWAPSFLCREHIKPRYFGLCHNAAYDGVMLCASNSTGCSFLCITYLLPLQTMSIWYKIKVMDAKWTSEWGEDTVVHWLTKLLWECLNASLAFDSAWAIIDEFRYDSALENLTYSVPCVMLVIAGVWWCGEGL